MTEIKLPFGLNENNTLVHIADVESGRKCCCICPSCNSPLIAVKGKQRQHHFRHDGTLECEAGLESAIHLTAKQIIMQEKQITIPEFICTVSETDSSGVEYTESKAIVQSGKIIDFDSVEEEVRLHGMRADILALKSDTPLIIEIFYRHKVDEQKLEKIASTNISAIEINLSDLKPEEVNDMETFRSAVVNNPKRMQWLYNAKTPIIEQELKECLGTKIQKKEKEYELKEIERQKKEQKEKKQLIQALDDLKPLWSDDRIARLKQEAQTHHIWKRNSRYLPFSWHELPDFLNMDVPNGDWIFGCDRRLWQTSFYSYFICKKGKAFSVHAVDGWLQNTVGCKVPYSVKIIGIYGRRYPKLVPDDLSGNLPSSWKTLSVYFDRLCDLGMLEYSGYDKKHSGSFWFKVVSQDSFCGN